MLINGIIIGTDCSLVNRTIICCAIVILAIIDSFPVSLTLFQGTVKKFIRMLLQFLSVIIYLRMLWASAFCPTPVISTQCPVNRNIQGCDCALKVRWAHPHICGDSREFIQIQTFAAHSFRACLLRPALKMNYLLLNGSEERYNYRLTHCTLPGRCVEADKSVIFFITFSHRVGEADLHRRGWSTFPCQFRD